MGTNKIFLPFLLILLTFGCSKEYDRVDFPSIGVVQKMEDANPKNLSLKCVFEGEFDKLNYNLEAVGFVYTTEGTVPTIEDNILPGIIASDNGSFTGISDQFPHSKTIFIRGYLDLGTAIIYSPVFQQAPLPSGFITLKQLAAFANERTEAVAFSIQNKGYVGTGSLAGIETPLEDFWEYDPESNTWAQIANFPQKVSSAYSFVIDNTAYVGGGSITASDFSVWATNFFASYDQFENKWVQLTSIPQETAGAIGFNINQKGYVFGGVSGREPTALNGIWMYDPSMDTWIAKNPAPIGISGVSGVVHKNIAYIGPGYSITNTFLSYEPETDQWKGLPFIPDHTGGDFLSFTYKDEIYVGFGLAANSDDITSSMWQYNPVGRRWQNFYKLTDNLIDPHFTEGITFTIQDRVFVGTGRNASGYTSSFFEVIFEE